MGQSLSHQVDRIEKSLTLTLDSSITPATVDLNQRLQRCFVSYNQLLQDVKRLNWNLTKQFINPENDTIIKFQIYSKLPQSQLNSKWKYSDNIVITATPILYNQMKNKDVSITDEKMADSSFGQGCHQARILRKK